MRTSILERTSLENYEVPTALFQTFFSYQQGLCAIFVGAASAVFAETLLRGADLMDGQLRYLENLSNASFNMR